MVQRADLQHRAANQLRAVRKGDLIFLRFRRGRRRRYVDGLRIPVAFPEVFDAFAERAPELRQPTDAEDDEDYYENYQQLAETKSKHGQSPKNRFSGSPERIALSNALPNDGVGVA